MSKKFKRCPRCNSKTLVQLKRCGNCGLNYDKFASATNSEAKSAFRMGEKHRVLYSKSVPSDVSRIRIFFCCLLGGWFGLHHFKIGRFLRGMVQLAGSILGFVYTYGVVYLNLRAYSGYINYLLFLCGLVWLYSFITWLSDSVAILFKRFKYPVSLPYSEKTLKLNYTQEKNEKVIENSNKNSNQDIGDKKKDTQINKDNQPDNKNDETNKYKNKNNDKGE